MKILFRTLVLTALVSSSAFAAGYNEAFVNLVKSHSSAQHNLKFKNSNEVERELAQTFNYAILRIITLDELHELSKPQYAQKLVVELNTLRIPWMAASHVKEAYLKLRETLITYLSQRLVIMMSRELSADAKIEKTIYFNNLYATNLITSSSSPIKTNEAADDYLLIKNSFAQFLKNSAAAMRK